MCNINFGEITYADVIESLTFVTILIGGVFAFYKWNLSRKLTRAEHVKSLMEDIRTNPKIVFNKFDYEHKWYTKDFHNNLKNESETEQNIDYTLSFFSYICYLRNNNIIGKKDLSCFRYELERILTNKQFKEYMYNLYHHTRKSHLPIPFVDLFEYAKNNKYFDSEFWNKNSKQYPHNLNF